MQTTTKREKVWNGEVRVGREVVMTLENFGGDNKELALDHIFYLWRVTANPTEEACRSARPTVRFLGYLPR